MAPAPPPALGTMLSCGGAHREQASHPAGVFAGQAPGKVHESCSAFPTESRTGVRPLAACLLEPCGRFPPSASYGWSALHQHLEDREIDLGVHVLRALFGN